MSTCLQVGVLAGPAAGAAIGCANGLLVAKARIAPFIVTLGAMAILRALALQISNGCSTNADVEAYGQLGNGTLCGLPYPLYVFVALAVIVYVLAAHTPFGRRLYATGSNERAALLAAIPVDRMKVAVYTLCGLFTGVAAVLESSRLTSVSASSSGVSYELDAIAAAVIGGISMAGGRGSIPGAVCGVLILGMLNNSLNLANISPFLQGAVKGAIILLAVLIQKREAR